MTTMLLRRGLAGLAGATALASACALSVTGAPLEVADLRCEYRLNPVGLDVREPRFSWTLRGNRRGERQTAYRVLAASSRGLLAADRGDLWDSGQVPTNRTIHVVYAGRPLQSRQCAWWKVRVWDKDGERSPWSSAGAWSMGLLDRADWQALWIAVPTNRATASVAGTGASALPATMLRKAFRLTGPVRRATAHVTAEGVYELRVNGHRVGQDLLAPEWTSYRHRVQYQTEDVTGYLRRGENVVAAQVGEGWYAGRLMAVGRFAYGTQPRFLLQLEIESDDGARQVIVSDGTWRGTVEGPITAAGIYDGETYDARKEWPGWDAPGFADRAWQPVTTRPLDQRALVWRRNEPITPELELSVARVTEPRPGVYVFDLGQNMVGWCRLRAHGVAGQPVTMRHGEMLNADGTLYTANLRGAPQIDRYTPRTTGQFTFEPHFTYHGFRYVELTGLARRPGPGALVGRVFHSATPRVGWFTCSDASLTRLMENIVWTARANLMSSPNDCPQRDERFGWMGDIQAFAQTAVFSFDLAAFFTKWLQDVRDDQAADGRFPDFAPHPGDPNTQFSGVPAWADAGVIVPWRAYENYADARLLLEHREAAQRWVDYVHRLNPDLIWRHGRGNDYNDWLNGDWIKQTGWPTNGASVPKEVFATAFFAHAADLVARMAAQTGAAEQAARYAALFRDIKAAFNRSFVSADGRIAGDTQGGYALALSFDLLPDEFRSLATEHLVANIHRYHDHLSTGIQTTHRAMLELVRQGQTDLGWQMLTNRTFPSWLYMLDNGATTVWERWDGYVKGRGFQDAGMNSFNHWAFGAVGEWLWRHVAGLNPDVAQPGWRHFVVAPKPSGGLTWARGDYDSIHGRIRAGWRLDRGRFTLELSVPPNTSADVHLPALDPDHVREGGRPARQAPGVTWLGSETGEVVFRVEAGHYSFRVPSPVRPRS
jgi:alpha-L-rhamnosidase